MSTGAYNGTMFDAAKVKADFPLLSTQGREPVLTYLDSAATSQKPEVVLRAMDRFYRSDYANVHRGVHRLAESATEQYEQARQAVAGFIGASEAREVVFTRGTTESINLVRYTWARDNLKRGDAIVVTEMEHHANLVPWVMLAEEQKVELRVVTVTETGELNRADLQEKVRGASLVCISHISNVLGTINPITEIGESAHAEGAKVLVDAAQSVPHLPINVQELGADFVAFSAHKMLGPTAIGALWVKLDLLETLRPFMGGGHMIRNVTQDSVSYAEVPRRLEAGTMPVAEAVGWRAAIEYLQNLGMSAVREHELALTRYALDTLARAEGVNLYGPLDASKRGGLVSFTVDGVHAHDLATLLDDEGVAIRSGHHCAQPLHERLGVPATARASFSVYNTNDDIDRLVAGIRAAQQVFSVGV